MTPARAIAASGTAAVLCVVATIAYVPIAWSAALAVEGIRTGALDHVTSNADLFIRSVAIALCTTLLSVTIGATAALALEYVRIPFRRALWLGVVASFFLPQSIVAIAWIEFLGAKGAFNMVAQATAASTLPSRWLYTPIGVTLVQTLTLYPVAAFFTAARLARFNSAYEDAALHIRRRRFIARILLPYLAPSLYTSAFVTFLFAVTTFSAASMLNVHVYAVEVFTRLNAFYDIAGGIVMSLPILALVAAFALLWRQLTKRSPWNLRDTKQRPRGTRHTRIASLLFTAFVVIASLGLPLATLLYRSLPPNSYIEAWQTAQDELLTSLALAATAATLLAALAFAMVVCADRFRAMRPLWWATALPFVISGPALGIALIAAWNRPGPRGAIYDSPAILLLAVTARFLFFAYLVTAIGASTIPRTLHEAAEVAGIRSSRRIATLTFPLIAPWLGLVWGGAFLLTLGEVDTTVLVAPPGYTTVPARLFALMHYGPSRLVAALSVLLIAAVIAGSAGAAFAWTRTRQYAFSSTR